MCFGRTFPTGGQPTDHYWVKSEDYYRNVEPDRDARHHPFLRPTRVDIYGSRYSKNANESISSGS